MGSIAMPKDMPEIVIRTEHSPERDGLAITIRYLAGGGADVEFTFTDRDVFERLKSEADDASMSMENYIRHKVLNEAESAS